MKIYIWQGNGISDAYHDDGTLVVAANTVDEARQIMHESRKIDPASGSYDYHPGLGGWDGTRSAIGLYAINLGRRDLIRVVC